ncbi:ribosome small subunit-dependent GTPase A [bacterium]|nr:ribosome small subunit-dependent GTPase A [bacterium]
MQEQQQKGQILKIHSDFYYVKFNGEELFECKIREVLKKQKLKILVGDFVFCENINSTKKTAVVTKLLPRKNFLTHPAVANVDQVVIVSAIKEPELDFEQLNRYICFAKYHHLKTKLCFNKNDLSEDDTIIEKVFEIYEHLGFEIIFTSALEKFGVDDLKDVLKGKTTVFCGSSGVGKSSLINAICPDKNIRTKEVSEKTQRGTHTTRHCEIINVKSGKKDIRIIDTPGFSRLTFDFLMPSEVGDLFGEIEPLKSKCKFKDCLHIEEDGCKVLENLDDIDISRYESYLAFVEEAKLYKKKIQNEGIKKETAQKSVANKEVAKISARKRAVSRSTFKQQLKTTLADWSEEK